MCSIVSCSVECSTSLPGGNQVDGLPPTSSLSFSGALYRVIRVQGELVVHIWETDINTRFRWFIENFLRSPSSIPLPRIFRGTIIYDASDGTSLRSLASL